MCTRTRHFKDTRSYIFLQRPCITQGFCFVIKMLLQKKMMSVYNWVQYKPHSFGNASKKDETSFLLAFPLSLVYSLGRVI